MSNCDCNQGRLPCSCKQNDTQSELAALREELANTTSVAKSEIEGLSLALQASQQRLAAAEKRNSELVDLIEKAHTWVDRNNCGGWDAYELRDQLAAAMNKSTESGVSE